MNEPTLTDTEREGLCICPLGIVMPEDTHTHACSQRRLAVECIVAARVAEAVDRERAAWATKIEALAKMWEGADEYARYNYGEATEGPLHAAAMRRGLLAADDTEGKP